MFAYRDALGAVVPTNDTLARSRHIGVAIGRDYRDVPPTRGVYRGQPASELSVAVQVHPADTPNVQDEFRRMDESDLSEGESINIEAEQQAAQQ